MITPRRLMPSILDLIVCLACVVLAILAVQLGYLSPRSALFPADAQVWKALGSGLYPIEQFSNRAETYHWTNGSATLVRPNPGGQIAVDLLLAGGPERITTAQLRANGTAVHFIITSNLRHYRFLLPPQPDQYLTLTLTSDTFRETNGERLLGIVVSNTTVAGGGVAPWNVTFSIALAVAALYGLARVASLRLSLAATIAVGAATIAALYLQASWQDRDPLLAVRTGTVVLGIILLAAAARQQLLSWPRSVQQALTNVLAHPITITMAFGATAIVVGYRLFSLINTYAVNMMFWDQWGFYEPLFSGQGVWGMVLFQHGPHRQGLGGVILTITATLSGWNSRADGFVVGGIIVLAMLIAIWLKQRLFGRLTLIDILLPLIVLGTNHAESVTTVPNPAHGATPLVLTLLYALAWQIRRPAIRYSLVVLLNVGLVFTGFGIFMGLITPALLVISLVWNVRSGKPKLWRWPLVALGGALLTIYSFSIGYKFETASACFQFPHPRLWEYLWFMGLMLARFFGLPFAVAPVEVTIFGCAVLALLVGIGSYHALIVLREGVYTRPISRTIAILIGFSLLFCANSAVGRVCSGVGSGQASRYMTLLVPAFVGLYLHILTIQRVTMQSVSLAVFMLLLLPLPLPGRIDETQVISFYASGKQRWKECYLANEQATECSRRTGFDIYPAPSQLGEQLAFLKAHGLNLYQNKPTP